VLSALIEHVTTHDEALFPAIFGHDQECIVAKRMDAPYRAVRQPTWLKVTNVEHLRRGAVEWHGGRSLRSLMVMRWISRPRVP